MGPINRHKVDDVTTSHWGRKWVMLWVLLLKCTVWAVSFRMFELLYHSMVLENHGSWPGWYSWEGWRGYLRFSIRWQQKLLALSLHQTSASKNCVTLWYSLPVFILMFYSWLRKIYFRKSLVWYYLPSYFHAKFLLMTLVKLSIPRYQKEKIPHHLAIYVIIYMLILYKPTAHKSIISPEFFSLYVWSQMLAYLRYHTIATS